MLRPMLRRAAVAAIGVLVVTACSSGGSSAPPELTRDVTGITDPAVTVATPDGTSAPPTPLDYEIEWTELSERVDEGWITVPVDYANPRGPKTQLYVTRHRATVAEPIGPLLANRGGPGADGATFGLTATNWFDREITDNFDVIGWDPRGTGQSHGAVDCIDDHEFDEFFSTLDITPDDDQGRQDLVDMAERFAQRCVERVPHLAHIGTNNSARDLDAIRQALGVDQVTYFGFSYGSELGGVWATLFPTTVRAAVFDGAADPAATPLDTSLQQGAGFEAALDTFLAACSANASCAFHNGGDAAGAYDRLMAELDANPIPNFTNRPAVGRGVAAIATAQAMYSARYWPSFERALSDAQSGDGAGLLQLHDLYFGRQPDGSHSNLIEAFQAINCADTAERPTVEESDAEVDTIVAVAPRIFPYTTGSYSCTFFPEAVDPRIDITGVGAGPIVVIGTTGDPATPLESSRAMADALEDGRLVIVEANEHTGYQSSRCVRGIVHEYLRTLSPPDDGIRCS